MAEQQGSTIQKQPTGDELDQASLDLGYANAIVEVVRHHAELTCVANHFASLADSGVYERDDSTPSATFR